MPRPWRRALLALAPLLLAPAACGDDDDAAGGTRSADLTFTYEAPTTGPVDPAALATAVTDRLESIGVLVGGVSADEPGQVIVTIEDDRLVELAGSLLTQRGVLRFRPVLETFTGELETTPAALDLADQEVSLAELDDADATVFTHHLGPTLLDVGAVESASPVQSGSEWEIELLLHLPALEELNRAAVLCFGKQAECPTGRLAIVLDGEVLAAPSVEQAAYERDEVRVADALTEVEARRLAAVFQAGPLPVTLEQVDPPVDQGG